MPGNTTTWGLSPPASGVVITTPGLGAGGPQSLYLKKLPPGTLKPFFFSAPGTRLPAVKSLRHLYGILSTAHR